MSFGSKAPAAPRCSMAGRGQGQTRLSDRAEALTCVRIRFKARIRDLHVDTGGAGIQNPFQLLDLLCYFLSFGIYIHDFRLPPKHVTLETKDAHESHSPAGAAEAGLKQALGSGHLAGETGHPPMAHERPLLALRC